MNTNVRNTAAKVEAVFLDNMNLINKGGVIAKK
jgi:hypothetical protein